MSLNHQIAQPIIAAEASACAGVDLQFDNLNDAALVQLRTAVDGIPTDTVLAQRLLAASAGAGRVTRSAQWAPVLLQKGASYAIVVSCRSTATSVCVAQVGAKDAAADRWMTALPFNIAPLLWRSADAGDWTARPDTCLAFTVLGAHYTAAQQTLALGTVNVDGVCDLMIAAESVLPETGAACYYTIALPDGRAWKVDDGQVVNLPTAYTGPVNVSAHLQRGPHLAPMLQPGVSLITNMVDNESDYISPMFDANGATDLRVTFKAQLPPGSAVHVERKTNTDANWVTVPHQGSASQAAGILEITHQGPLAGATHVRIRLRLVGTPGARPNVNDLFAVTL